MSTKLAFLKNKNIAILGLGIENIALIKYLLGKRTRCRLTICDDRGKNELRKKYREWQGQKSISWQLGPEAHKDLGRFDLLFRSPGWPLFDPAIMAAAKKGVSVSSPIRLFFDLCPSRNIVGVTGTKGKGTTASLIAHILRAAGRRVWLGGNIGVAPLSFLGKIRPRDWIVLELSSFQLEDMETSPKIAVFTNFFPDHLAPADPHNPNHHRSLKEYWRAKVNILGWQGKSGWAVINRKLENRKIEFGYGKRAYFTKSNLATSLIGEHNRENVGAAVLAAKAAGARRGTIKTAVGSFSGLEHRIEPVADRRGVKYYDDSFATTPESAMTAIGAFASPLILIAGGAEKGAGFGKLAAAIKRKVKLTILLPGQATPRLKKELLAAGYPENKIAEASGMAEAVAAARQAAGSGDTVLLSPACASFGIFKNYKERGESFKKEAMAGIHKKRP